MLNCILEQVENSFADFRHMAMAMMSELNSNCFKLPDAKIKVISSSILL